MNIRIVREEIRQVFEAMNEQMEIIQQHKDKIPQIEIDLFMSNVRDLYEACISLNKLNMSLGSPDQPVVDEIPVTIEEIPIRETIKFMSQVEESNDLTQDSEEKSLEISEEETTEEENFVDEYEIEAEPDIPEEVLQPEPVTIPDPEPEIVTVREPEAQVEVIVEPEPIPEYEPIVLISPKPEAEADRQFPQQPESLAKQPLETPSPDLFSTGTTIAEKFKEEKVTLNQRLQAEKPKMNIGTQLHHNQIRDLKSSIGINEKFQFINDLFKGNMQDYTLAITQLNQFSNFEEALEYIDILKFKYTWDINSDAHHKLMDFVRRRYL